jgi:3',5'-cyclic AMP phosphodiesterase CpdA
MIARRKFVKLALAGTTLPLIELRPADAGGSQNLRFLFLTDVHAMLDRNAPAKMDDIASRIRDLGIDLIIGGGDFVDGGFTSTPAQMEPKFALLRRFLEKINHPIEAVAGNHDLVGVCPADGSTPEPDPARYLRETFGLRTLHRTFDHGTFRFIVLDSVEPLPAPKTYRGHVSAEQILWIKSLLDSTPKDQPIVLCSHIPFRSTFLQNKDGPEAPLPDNLVVTNANDVLALFEGHNLPLVLQGHLHVNEVIHWNKRTFLTGGAVSGAWWKGDNWGTEPGFGTVEITPSHCDWTYLT